MRLIRPKDYRRMPWKNGGGETIEIAVFPRGADTGDFDWRVSMAKVDTDGPFSAFPEIDRTLAILEGNGIDLVLEGQEPVRIAERAVSFPGDVPTSAKLLGGPVTDLNVMTRRGKFVHKVTELLVTGTSDFVVMSPIALLYCHRGEVTIDEEFVAPIAVGQGTTLYVEAMPNSLRLTSKDESRLFLIEINRAV